MAPRILLSYPNVEAALVAGPPPLWPKARAVWRFIKDYDEPDRSCRATFSVVAPTVRGAMDKLTIAWGGLAVWPDDFRVECWQE